MPDQSPMGSHATFCTLVISRLSVMQVERREESKQEKSLTKSDHILSSSGCLCKSLPSTSSSSRCSSFRNALSICPDLHKASEPRSERSIGAEDSLSSVVSRRSWRSFSNCGVEVVNSVQRT